MPTPTEALEARARALRTRNARLAMVRLVVVLLVTGTFARGVAAISRDPEIFVAQDSVRAAYQRFNRQISPDALKPISGLLGEPPAPERPRATEDCRALVGDAKAKCEKDILDLAKALGDLKKKYDDAFGLKIALLGFELRSDIRALLMWLPSAFCVSWLWFSLQRRRERKLQKSIPSSERFEENNPRIVTRAVELGTLLLTLLSTASLVARSHIWNGNAFWSVIGVTAFIAFYSIAFDVYDAIAIGTYRPPDAGGRADQQSVTPNEEWFVRLAFWLWMRCLDRLWTIGLHGAPRARASVGCVLVFASLVLPLCPAGCNMRATGIEYLLGRTADGEPEECSALGVEGALNREVTRNRSLVALPDHDAGSTDANAAIDSGIDSRGGGTDGGKEVLIPRGGDASSDIVLHTDTGLALSKRDSGSHQVDPAMSGAGASARYDADAAKEARPPLASDAATDVVPRTDTALALSRRDGVSPRPDRANGGRELSGQDDTEVEGARYACEHSPTWLSAWAVGFGGSKRGRGTINLFGFALYSATLPLSVLAAASAMTRQKHTMAILRCARSVFVLCACFAIVDLSFSLLYLFLPGWALLWPTEIIALVAAVWLANTSRKSLAGHVRRIVFTPALAGVCSCFVSVVVYKAFGGHLYGLACWTIGVLLLATAVRLMLFPEGRP
jgi:hypothetical protein